MKIQSIQPTGVERYFDEEEIIVSKTDLSGRITYANQVFLKISGFSEAELLGEQHNIIRHPDMPRCVFKFLWDTLESGKEIFAYVINQCKNGDHYWVFAHVTPTFDANRRIISYHSNRRVPERKAVQTVTGLYRTLRNEELKHSDSHAGMNSALGLLVNLLKEKGMEYDELVWTL